MALIEGVKYGLSSFPNSSNTRPSSPTAPVSSNKSVLFVKLTDSAIKAIEDYLKTQQKTGQNATLQFLGNEGRINIPSSHSSQGQTFDFSLQSNADIEGPQGSFECIQQSSSRSLESLGPLPFKMRIKANDDVYAETRQRFMQAEDIRKQECAKEIKPNGPDIGRKVKKKLDRISAPIMRREPSPFSSHSKFSPSNSSVNAKSSNQYGNNTSSSVNKHFSGFNPIGNNASNNVNSRPSSGIKPGAGPSDIAKRPLKERLIHLLAIRPFKKPELQARLSRDGIKDREKQLVMTILKQISTFKNMEYVLLRGVWNDIQEDWPCYTEQERQLMKRRKPQNLTPPGSDSSVSSGVSGCSGLSPRSTASTSSGGHCSPNSHFGAKSGSRSSQAHGSGGKRPLSNDLVGPDGILLEDISSYVDGPNNKKARVSHFKRPIRNGASSTSLSANFGRTDRDGLSPNLHQNRIADRLSPIGSINGSCSNNTNHANIGSHSFANNHSPSNMDSSSSPFYNTGVNNNNHPSPQEPFHEGGDNMGGFSPYSWNSNGNDPQGNQAMDSDETDSIDSGNGSSTSTSGRRYHHTDEPAFNEVTGFQTGSLSIPKPPNRGVEHGGSQSAFVVNSASCNRVSSTTHGSGSSGYHLSPQSSPESNNEPLQLLPQQKDESEVKQRQSTGQGYLNAGGVCSDNASGAGHGSSSKYSREGHDDHRERRGDKERSSGRERVKDKEPRPKDRERNDRKDREERKSAQGADTNNTRKSTVNGNNFDNLTKPLENPDYLKQYTPIETDEQRSRYKDDFNSDYPLYRDLHAVITKVSKKFAQLEERLHEEVRGSEEYQNIRDQIVREYFVHKKDKKYQDAKDKFHYLHKKLAYIKDQVANYDHHSISHEMTSPVR